MVSDGYYAWVGILAERGRSLLFKESLVATEPGAPESTSARERLLREAEEVRRPVALLELIGRIDTLEVDDDLVLAVVEAVQSGVHLDRLFTAQVTDIVQETEKEEEEEAPELASVTPIPVYRLGDRVRIFFGGDGLPVGPPAGHVFVTSLRGKKCFGIELHVDNMYFGPYPNFKAGDILVFSTEEQVESGDFVFCKTRHSDEFTQVIFGREDLVRLRALNPQHEERAVRRFEIKVMCKLVGRFEKF